MNFRVSNLSLGPKHSVLSPYPKDPQGYQAIQANYVESDNPRPSRVSSPYLNTTGSLPLHRSSLSHRTRRPVPSYSNSRDRSGLAGGRQSWGSRPSPYTSRLSISTQISPRDRDYTFFMKEDVRRTIPFRSSSSFSSQPMLNTSAWPMRTTSPYPPSMHPHKMAAQWNANETVNYSLWDWEDDSAEDSESYSSEWFSYTAIPESAKKGSHKHKNHHEGKKYQKKDETRADRKVGTHPPPQPPITAASLVSSSSSGASTVYHSTLEYPLDSSESLSTLSQEEPSKSSSFFTLISPPKVTVADPEKLGSVECTESGVEAPPPSRKKVNTVENHPRNDRHKSKMRKSRKHSDKPVFLPLERKDLSRERVSRYREAASLDSCSSSSSSTFHREGSYNSTTSLFEKGHKGRSKARMNRHEKKQFRSTNLHVRQSGRHRRPKRRKRKHVSMNMPPLGEPVSGNQVQALQSKWEKNGRGYSLAPEEVPLQFNEDRISNKPSRSVSEQLKPLLIGSPLVCSSQRSLLRRPVMELPIPPHQPPSSLLQLVVNSIAYQRDVATPSIPPEVIIAFDEYIRDGTKMLRFRGNGKPVFKHFFVKFINLYEVNDEVIPEVVFGWKKKKSDETEGYFLLNRLTSVVGEAKDDPWIECRRENESPSLLSFTHYLRKYVVTDDCIFRLVFSKRDADASTTFRRDDFEEEVALLKAPNPFLYYSWLVFSDFICSIGNE